MTSRADSITASTPLPCECLRSASLVAMYMLTPSTPESTAARTSSMWQRVCTTTFAFRPRSLILRQSFLALAQFKIKTQGVHIKVREREREREGGRKGEMQTQTHRHRHRHRHTDTDTQTHIHTHRHTHTDAHTDAHIKVHKGAHLALRSPPFLFLRAAEPECPRHTQGTHQLSVNGARCLEPNCQGTMRKQYSERMLYTQLSYFVHLFNVPHAVKQVRGRRLAWVEGKGKARR